MFTPEPLDLEFITWFKKTTEAHWETPIYAPWNHDIEFEPGTKWNPGLTQEEISEYEAFIGTRFPNDLRFLLSHLNGTDKNRIHIQNKDEPPCEILGIYSFPRDITELTTRMEIFAEDREDILGSLSSKHGLTIEDVHPIPFFSHRYVLSMKDPHQSPVASVMGYDSIFYGRTLKQYLLHEFIPGTTFQPVFPPDVPA